MNDPRTHHRALNLPRESRRANNHRGRPLPFDTANVLPAPRRGVRLIQTIKPKPGPESGSESGDAVPSNDYQPIFRFRRFHPSTPKPAQDAQARAALITDLSQTLHLWPAEIDLDTQRGRCRIANGLRRALRGQRRRARSGNWSYDIACHARLIDLHCRVVVLQHSPCRLCRRGRADGARIAQRK